MVSQVAELQVEIQEAFQNPPEGFLDPLMGSLMEQPVRLPSSNKVSRKYLIHIYSFLAKPYLRFVRCT